ncbi:MAG: hypothetical protein ACAI38_10855 [Myxococcota bacterium]
MVRPAVRREPPARDHLAMRERLLLRKLLGDVAPAGAKGAPVMSATKRAEMAQRGFAYHDFSDPLKRLSACLRRGIPTAPVEPVHDYARSGALVVEAYRDYDSAAMFEALARELPASVPLFVVSSHDKHVRDAMVMFEVNARARGGDTYFVTLWSNGNPQGEPEWMRDHFGLWVRSEQGKAKVVTAQYYNGNTVTVPFCNMFRAGRHHEIPETIEFGNSARIGKQIFLVDSVRLGGSMPEDYVATGAHHVHVLPHLTNAKGEKVGIGHADERIFPMSDQAALTDSAEYAEYLRACGLEVDMLPSLMESKVPSCTYANALGIVTDTEKVAFVPQFASVGVDPAIDARARDVYAKHGYRVVPYDSGKTAVGFNGGIHCQTVVLPSFLDRLDQPNGWALPRFTKVTVPPPQS